MRWLHYLRTRSALLAELETLRSQNKVLTEERDTARMWSWVRLHPSRPVRRRPDPHPVPLGRHRHGDDDRTEIFPRAVLRRDITK